MTETRTERPIMIVSVGRSGSTLLHDVMSHHPEVAWLSSLANTHPESSTLQSWFLRGVDLPMVGRLVRRAWDPSEAYAYWEYRAKGFERPFRSLRATDLTEKARRDVKAALVSIRTRRRHRLLLKVTGWSRVPYLKSLFPDARFVHIVRDGRAVANSMMQTPWWRGWMGPSGWRFGDLTAEDREQWEAHSRSFIVLAALQWRFVLRSIEDDLADLPRMQRHEVRYEDLCAHPVDVCREIASFCGLPWERSFARSIQRRSFRGTNAKYKQDLTRAQIRDMEDVLGPVLARYGYAYEEAAPVWRR